MPRLCFTSTVRPEQVEDYRRAHASVWPQMLAALRDTGWRDYRLFLRPDGLLIGFVETDDYEAAQERMSATEVNARWQAAMTRFFAADGAPDEAMVMVPEIFHLEGQLEAVGLPTAPSPRTA